MEYNNVNDARVKASLDVAHANARAMRAPGGGSLSASDYALAGTVGPTVENEVSGLMNYLENVLDELDSKIERLGEKISPVLLPPGAYDAGSPPYGNTDMGKFIVRLIERSMNMRDRVQNLGDRVGL